MSHLDNVTTGVADTHGRRPRDASTPHAGRATALRYRAGWAAAGLMACGGIIGFGLVAPGCCGFVATGGLTVG